MMNRLAALGALLHVPGQSSIRTLSFCWFDWAMFVALSGKSRAFRGSNERLVLMASRSFWRNKKLSQLSQKEWESLCDGCAKCCLLKLEEEDTNKIYYTDVACRLLDSQKCRCTDYENRKSLVPDCVKLSPKNIKALKWMPKTCAYRLVAEGKELLQWHPLISGSARSVHEAGISVRGKVIPEREVTDVELEDRIVDWVD